MTDVKAKQEEALKQAGKTRQGKKPNDPSDTPDPKAQRNFTDPESRIMKDGASKSFEQAYNCQIASDEQAQVIVGTNVTQETNDKQQVKSGTLLHGLELTFGKGVVVGDVGTASRFRSLQRSYPGRRAQCHGYRCP